MNLKDSIILLILIGGIALVVVALAVGETRNQEFCQDKGYEEKAYMNDSYYCVKEVDGFMEKAEFYCPNVFSNCYFVKEAT